MKDSNSLSSVECAAKVAASLSQVSDDPRKKFNAFAYDHQTKTCITGNVSPFSTNFNTTAKFKRTDITTGSLYVIRDCLPKRKFILFFHRCNAFAVLSNLWKLLYFLL